MTTLVQKLDYRCLGNFCQQASHCRRHTRPEKGQIIPLAAFDVRDKPDGRCDGYVPRIMEPIRVESEGGEQ